MSETVLDYQLLARPNHHQPLETALPGYFNLKKSTKKLELVLKEKRETLEINMLNDTTIYRYLNLIFCVYIILKRGRI